MNTISYSEDEMDLYLIHFCPRANDVYRFAYALTLDKKKALQCVDRCFQSLTELLSEGGSQDTRALLITHCWRAFQAGDSGAPDGSRLASLWDDMSIEERVCLAASDLWGMPGHEIATCLQFSSADVKSHLSSARDRLRINTGKHVQRTLKTFSRARGLLQNSMHELSLAEADLQKIREKVGTAASFEELDEQRIEKVESSEVASRNIRIGALIAVPASLVLALYFAIAHKTAAPFQPLQALAGECELLEEEGLAFPNSNHAEIADFLKQHPGLNFKPQLFIGNLGAEWRLKGAEVIAYDQVEVAVVGYENTLRTEHLYHFSYPGQLAALPPAHPGQLRDFTYQAYASRKVNMIAWQSGDQTVSMLVGHLSAEDLSKLALKGLSL